MRGAAGLLLALALCIPARDALADNEIIRLDASRSHAGFRVKLVWLLGVDGRFGTMDGTVAVDPFRNQLRVDARIAVDSLRMARASQERWAKSAEFFDAERHPDIHFVSEPFPRARLAAGGELRGELTVRGVRQSVRFELQPSDCVRPAFDCPIRVDGSIRRSRFGMDAHRGTLSDRVELDFTVYAHPGASGVAAPG